MFMSMLTFLFFLIFRNRNINYAGCLIEWDKPTQYGGTDMVGYKLRINDKIHDELPPKATTYLYTSGKMCKDYTFTLQVRIEIECITLNSKNIN